MCDEVDRFDHDGFELVITSACSDQDLNRASTFVSWNQEIMGDKDIDEPGVPLRKLVRAYAPDAIAFAPVYFTDDDPFWGMRIGAKPFPKNNEVCGFTYLLLEDVQGLGIDPHNQQAMAQLMARDIDMADAFGRADVRWYEITREGEYVTHNGLFYSWGRMARSVNGIFSKLKVPALFSRDECSDNFC